MKKAGEAYPLCSWKRKEGVPGAKAPLARRGDTPNPFGAATPKKGWFP